MVLLVVSDYDPEGLALARDAIRSLRDLWRIPIVYHRVAVTQAQIEGQGLFEDYNPAKKDSVNFAAFVEETGSDRAWECQALAPEYLRAELRAAIEANMNTEILRAGEAKEAEDIKVIHETRAEIARGFLDKDPGGNDGPRPAARAAQARQRPLRNLAWHDIQQAFPTQAEAEAHK